MRVWNSGAAIRWAVLFLLIALLVFTVQPFAANRNYAAEVVEGPVIYYTVKEGNGTSLRMEAVVVGYSDGLVISNSFANVGSYVDFGGMSAGSGLVYSGFSLSPEEGMDSYSFDYVVNFPVTGFGVRNYSVFKDGEGVAESVFLFFRPEESSIHCNVDFSGVGTGVFNSAHGWGAVFNLSLDDLMNSYFVFGNYSCCEGEYGDKYLNVLFGGGFEKNETVCNTIQSLFDYYYNEFGEPLRLKNNYSVGFFPAKAYKSLSSGFFGNDYNFSWFSHEMFHLWQPGLYDCPKGIIYKEGLTTFIQWDALKGVGKVNDSYVDYVFDLYFLALKNVTDLESLYYMSEPDLYKLRETDQRTYYILAYLKGALVWKEIADSGASVNELFRYYLETGDCSKMSDLMEKFEGVVHERLLGANK